jgi:hypothetical protein
MRSPKNQNFPLIFAAAAALTVASLDAAIRQERRQPLLSAPTVIGSNL